MLILNRVFRSVNPLPRITLSLSQIIREHIDTSRQEDLHIDTIYIRRMMQRTPFYYTDGNTMGALVNGHFMQKLLQFHLVVEDKPINIFAYNNHTHP